MVHTMFAYFGKSCPVASTFSEELIVIVGEDGEMLTITCWDD
jgi:hypothetical protein